MDKSIDKFNGVNFDREFATVLKDRMMKGYPSKHKGALEIINMFDDLSMEAIESHCESPIEKQVAYALWLVAKREGEFVQVVSPRVLDGVLSADDDAGKALGSYLKSASLLIVPNAPFDFDGKKYRVDFLIIHKPLRAKKHRFSIVECDSFQYHSSADHLEKDKKRERAILKAGWPIYRFSGREIHRNPLKVAYEILESVLKKTYGEE